MAKTKLETFAQLISLNARGVLTDFQLLNQVIDRIFESPGDLILLLDAAPPNLVDQFCLWADRHPVDDATWTAWMNQQLFNLSSAGSHMLTDEEKQLTRTIIERFRRWHGRRPQHDR